MNTRSKPRDPLPILEAFQGFTPFHEVMHFYVDLNCALIGPDLPSKWWTLNRRVRPYSLYELEKRYRQTDPRGRYLKSCIQTARKEKAAFRGSYLGFRDLFVPILRKGKILGFLVAGAFADHELDRSGVLACWERLAGGQAPAGPGFQDFTRILLDIPVLEGEVLEAYQETLELFAGLLGGETDPDTVADRTLYLRRAVFSRNLPHLKFMRWALGFEASESLPTWDVEIENWDWVRDEVGITRIPTTVIAVIPKNLEKRPDPLERALGVYRFQRRSFLFAQTLPQAVGGKLENYGAVFVTSADPSLPRTQQDRQIQTVARRIHAFALRELGGQALVGVGESVPRGEILESSYRKAVLALHLGSRTGREMVTQDSVPEKGIEGVLALNRLLNGMTRLLAEASRGDLEVLQESYLKQVLTLAFQDPVQVRWHLHYALIQWVEVVRSRLDWPQREADGLQAAFSHALEKAPTTQELLLAFKGALAQLLENAERGKIPAAEGSVRKARDHVNAHFREPLRIGQLARMAGVSVSTFSRRFKELTGTGWEAYLWNLRLAEAKRLLRTGRLPVALVARDCGFRSSAYFIRAFRKATGKTPLAFRLDGSQGL